MEAPAGAASAATRAARRVNQDYVKMYQFLTSDIWQMLGSQDCQRAKAEALCEYSYLTLDLRLPTEQTLGMMTALVVCANRQIHPFDLQTALQLTRSSWKSVFKRLERNAARIDLLPTLPGTFAELPAHIQGRLNNVAGHEMWLLTEGELDVLMRRIRLRANGNSSGSADAATLLAQSLLSIFPGACGRVGAKENEVQLKNLQLFSPKRGVTYGRRALPRAADGAPSHVNSGGAVDGLLALRDLPAGESRKATSVVQPAGLDSAREGGPTGSGIAGPARSEGCGPAGSGADGGCEPAGSQGVVHRMSAPAGETAVPLQDIDREGNAFESPRAAQRGEHGQRPVGSPLKAVVATSPFPFASDFLKQRGEKPNSSLEPVVMKRPAARKDSTTARRGLKRPAAASKPQAAGKDDRKPEKRHVAKVSKPKGKATPKRRDAKDGFRNYSFRAKGYGACRVEYYTAKSYIRKWDEKMRRYTMIIGSTGDRHQQVCSALIKHVQAGLPREKLLALRSTLMVR